MLKQVIAIIPILFLSLKSVSQAEDVCSRASDIIKTIEKHHYNPKSINDDFSILVYTKFLEDIDAGNLVLSKENTQQLDKYRAELDDLFLERDCKYLDEVYEVYLSQINHIKQLITGFKVAKLDYGKEESVVFLKGEYLKSQKELDEYWRKKIKYQVLFSYLSLSDSVIHELPTDSDFFERQNKIIDRGLCLLDQALTIKEMGDIYLNAVAFAFDPHSSYFSTDTESEFDLMLSKESYSFGFELGVNDIGEYEIEGLVPGGPAWKSNQINEGDVLLSIKVKDEVLNLDGCNAMDDIKDLFARKNNKLTIFKIRKVNGDVIEVQLYRDVIEVQANIIQSFILEDDKKIGYLYLPSFYFSSNSSVSVLNGCANDIAKELIKLKREGIEGLILDLRNNGGGSMQEAIRMIGIFIDYGTVCMIDSRQEGEMTLKDMDKGTVFDKPLVVLNNSLSASASELFSAAIQDYNRGVIVGSTTFGKGTAQSIVSLDAYKKEYLITPKESRRGYLKLTHSKFFRVTGVSHQNTGIVPDVFIPNRYDFVNINEHSYVSSLEATTIDKKSYYRPLNQLPISYLKEKSNTRIADDSLFLDLVEEGKKIAENYLKKTIPLDYHSFIEYYALDVDQDSGFEPRYSVENPSYIKGISDVYNSELEINQDLMLEIADDLQINESYNIMLDLINHK